MNRKTQSKLKVEMRTLREFVEIFSNCTPMTRDNRLGRVYGKISEIEVLLNEDDRK